MIMKRLKMKKKEQEKYIEETAGEREEKRRQTRFCQAHFMNGSINPCVCLCARLHSSRGESVRRAS